MRRKLYYIGRCNIDLEKEYYLYDKYLICYQYRFVDKKFELVNIFYDDQIHEQLEAAEKDLANSKFQDKFIEKLS